MPCKGTKLEKGALRFGTVVDIGTSALSPHVAPGTLENSRSYGLGRTSRASDANRPPQPATRPLLGATGAA